jgi:hypothetical protein
MCIATNEKYRIRQILQPILLLSTIILATPAFTAPDFTLKGEHLSGDYGTGESRNRESVSLRVAKGDRLRFWTELRTIRAESPLGIANTPLGPAPLDGEQVRDRIGQGEPGGNGEGDAGPGSGSVQGELAAGGGWSSGIGDVEMGLTARILGKAAGLFRLDGEFEVKVPTAEEEEGLGTGEWDVRVGLSGERRFWSLTSFAGVGWNRLGDPDWIDLEDAVDLFAGIETEPFGREMRGSVWIEGNTETVPGAGSRMVIGAGLRNGGRLPWRLSAFAGITDASEDLGLTFAMSLGGKQQRAGRRERVP